MDKSRSTNTERADGEVTAVAKIVRIMKTLDPEGQERIAAYIHERFGAPSFLFPTGRVDPSRVAKAPDPPSGAAA